MQNSKDQFNCRIRPDMALKFISECEGIVTIQFDSRFLEPVSKLIYNLSNNLFHENEFYFQRRVIPYFLNQFMIWTRNQGYSEAHQVLLKIKNQKKSKQRKFELGDLRKLFESKFDKMGCFKSEIKALWLDFLSGPAIERVQSGKKICYKERYLEAIARLRQEIEKPNPYERFLSRVAYEKYKREQNFEDAESYHYKID